MAPPSFETLVLQFDGLHGPAAGLSRRSEHLRRTILRMQEKLSAIEKCRKPVLAVRGSKEMLFYSRDHSVSESLNRVATGNAGMLSDADWQAGLQAKLEKRHADYED